MATALPTRRKLDVDEFYRMAAAGILGPDERVELIEGEIVELVPIGSEHGVMTSRLARVLMRAVGDAALVNTTSPLRLDTYNEPQPDLMILRARADDYMQSHPAPADVILVIEVAKATPAYDRSTKADLYATAGVPELWIVDLTKQNIEVCSEPRNGVYANRAVLSTGPLAPVLLAEAVIDVEGLFA